MSPPLRIDLHVHSTHSPDGTLTVERLVAALASARLDGFALTDHNTVSGHAELRELASRHPEYLLLPGVEVSTREGHLLVYGVAEAPPDHPSLAGALAWAAERGGVAVPAHPFRWSHGIGRRHAESVAVPAVEAVNGHNGRRANARAGDLAVRRRLGSTGGSDAHLAGDLGRAFTVLPENVRTSDELLSALRQGITRGEGSSAGALRQARSALRSGALRLARGLRPI